MRYHAFAAAMGLVTAAILAPGSRSQAAAVDPTGYWYKPDAVRESKIQVFKCGSGKSQLCAKIAWLKDPNDTKGKPLHDIRNENPSMRDRPIVGLTSLRASCERARDLDRPDLQSRGRPHLRGDAHHDVAHADHAPGLQGMAPLRREAVAEDLGASGGSARNGSRRHSADRGFGDAWCSRLRPLLRRARLRPRLSPRPSRCTRARCARRSRSPSIMRRLEAASDRCCFRRCSRPRAASPATTMQAAVNPTPQTMAQPVTLMSPAPQTGTPRAQKGYGFLNASMTSDTATKYSGENVYEHVQDDESDRDGARGQPFQATSRHRLRAATPPRPRPPLCSRSIRRDDACGCRWFRYRFPIRSRRRLRRKYLPSSRRLRLLPERRPASRVRQCPKTAQGASRRSIRNRQRSTPQMPSRSR